MIVGQTGLIAGVATILGFITTFAYAMFRIGKWANETKTSHEEQREDHYRLHRDMERMANSMNGEEFFMTSNCSTCQEVKDEVE